MMSAEKPVFKDNLFGIIELSFAQKFFIFQEFCFYLSLLGGIVQ